MKGKVAKIIVVLLIIIALFIPIIMDAVSNNVLSTIEYSGLEKTISETSNYGFKLVYVAPSSSETIKESKKSVKDTVSKYISPSDQKPLTAVYMDYDALSESEKTAIFNDKKVDVAYMFIVNGELLTTVTENLSATSLENYVSTYSANEVTKDLQNYKVPENADEYKKLVDRKKTVTMAVFGRNTCFYCNQFKVVYNDVAKEKDVDIYYFDSDSYNEEEYNKVMDLGLKIPASCSSTKEEVDLQPGFGTPLTLFTKNGKVIDCIDGYINKESLLTKLETVGMIEKSEDKTEDKSEDKSEEESKDKSEEKKSDKK